MDPNQDGFISVSASGFSNDGYNVDEFEIPMFGLPIYEDGEVLNDIQAGSNCGTTELTVDNQGFSVYGVLTTGGNLIFRFRIAKDRPSVEAYSVLIDTDGKIGSDDPNSTTENPGFEIDITLIKNNSKGVYVYNIDGIESCPNDLLFYPIASHFQISVADEVSCGDPDYFYDFFVPFSAVASIFNISTATELRFVALTNVSATCAMGGKISDVGGVDDTEFGGCNPCAFVSLTENQCPTALDDLCPTCQGFSAGVTPKPTINVPLKAGEFEISGTAIPLAEVFLSFFNSTGALKERDTTIADAGGNWVTIIGSAFAMGDSITAQARAPGQCNSGGTSSGTSFTIVIVNQAPVLAGPVASLNYTENNTATSIAPAITITDPDDVEIDGATVTMTTNYVQGQDMLSCVPPAGITASFDAPSGTLTLSGVSTLSNYQSALRAVSYFNNSEDPNTLQRTITYLTNDGLDNSNVFTATVQVTSVNDVPVLNSPQNTVTFNGVAVAINTGFTLTDADDVTMSSASVFISNNFVNTEDILVFNDQNGISGSYNSSNGILTLTGTASIANYIAALSSIQYDNSNGSPSLFTRRVSFSVFDGEVYSNVFQSFVGFPGVNNPPTITDGDGNPVTNLDYTIAEDAVLNACVSVNDPDGDPVVLDSFSGQVGPGTFALTGGLCFSFTPTANFNGQVTASLTACDQTLGSLCDVATVTVIVTPVNDAPAVVDASVSTVEEIPLQICVTFNDIENDLANLQSFVLTGTSGVLSDNNAYDLCFTYSPNADFVGKDTVTVSLCDANNNALCASGKIYITVTPKPNQEPETLINGIPGDTLRVEVLEDSVAVFCFEAVDPDGDDVALDQIVKNSTGGGNIALFNNIEFCFQYTPTANFNGLISWTVTVCDDQAPEQCSDVVILLTLLPVNDPPVITSNTFSTLEDSVTRICLQVTDIENDQIYFAQGVPQNLITTVVDTVTTDLCFDYITPSNVHGVDTVLVTVCDVNDNTVCTSADIIINVSERPNDPPVVVVGNDPIDTLRMTIAEDNVVTFCLNAVDPNDDAIVVGQTISHSGSGVFVNTSNLCFRYTPALNYFGTAAVEATLCDDEDPSLCGSLIIIFTITPVNDPPVILANTFTTLEDSTTTICVDVADVENAQVRFVSGIPFGSIGTVDDDVTGDRCFNYITQPNNYGVDSVRVTICESIEGTVCATKNIVANVLPRPNEPPVITQNGLPVDTVFYAINEDALHAFCLTAFDPNSDAVQFNSIVLHGGGGAMTNTTDLCFTYTPALNYFGTATTEIIFCDNETPSLCGSLTVIFTIAPVNDPPLALGDTLIATRNEEGMINLLQNDVDIDGDNLLVTEVQSETTSKGQYITELLGILRYRSDRYFRGDDNLTYEVCDDGSPSLCSQAEVKIVIGDLPLNPYEAFSPNNDDINEYWRIEGVDFYPQNVVQVFDRFNNLVFEMRNYNNEERVWKGNSNHGIISGELPEGIYYYSIVLEKGSKPLKGFVMMKR